MKREEPRTADRRPPLTVVRSKDLGRPTYEGLPAWVAEYAFEYAMSFTLGDEDRARDIVSAVEDKLLRGGPALFDDRRGGKNYIGRCVRSQVCDEVREWRKKDRFAPKLRLEAELSRSEGDDPVSALERKYQHEQLSWALYQLPFETRMMVCLMKAWGWTAKEVGRLYNMTPGAVQKRTERAVVELARILGPKLGKEAQR